jgi:RNA polymerase sigma-70 factor (ECF subfamily)
VKEPVDIPFAYGDPPVDDFDIQTNREDSSASPKSSEGEQAYLRLLDGDESAMETLVALYWESLIFFIGGYVRNFSDAEDLALETFIEFTASIEKFSGRSSVKTYLFSIGRNRALMFIRKHKNESRHSANTDTYGADKTADNGTEAVSPETDFLKDEQNKRLHAAMQELKKEYREVLYLLYFEEMSYKEASVVLGKNVKQIEKLSYRARISLRNTLDREDFVYV